MTCVEYKEVLELSYGVSVTALSSGFSLGASTWLIEGPNDRLAYVPAASGDLNRHPKELDLLPLVDCETLLLTDLKSDRDPHASTERMVERLLTSVSCVLDRGGVCVIPCSPTGVLFDLIEAVYVACVAVRAPAQSVPMYFVAPHASQVMTLTKSGAEWLCEKKIEKLYAGESAFSHEALVKSKILNVEADLTPALAAVFQVSEPCCIVSIDFLLEEACLRPCLSLSIEHQHRVCGPPVTAAWARARAHPNDWLGQPQRSATHRCANSSLFKASLNQYLTRPHSI